MMKDKIKCIIVVVIILITVIIVKNLTPEYNKLKIEKEILNALNDDVQYEFITDSEMKAHKKAKEKEVEEYEVTSIINNYIENVNICVKNHLDGNMNYNIVEYELNDSLVMHGLREEGFECIYDLITDSDIEQYNYGDFKSSLIKKLQNILKNKIEGNNIKWYIENDKDKIIELPYRVYIVFAHSDKKTNDVKCIKKIKFIEGKNYNCIVEYEKNDGTVYKENIYVNYKMFNGEKKFLINGFNTIYYKQTQNANLSFGQHDYDEAMERERERDAELGLNGDMSYLNVFGSVDETEEKETSHYLTDEEFEKAFKEINKKYGIE